MSDFQLLGEKSLAGLNITVQEYEHSKTGLKHYHLACDNDENAFMIGFATQPMTSRGEAHILEHTVLCGSEKYPVRDPFFSMIKRSLNTFMNAMTSSDWTVYPFASQNKKDYFNLLSVYLDAVFFANIHELDFAQEGVRIEIGENGKPELHGIVFNEMKGAMSGEIDQLYYALTPHLFPTTTYHYNSGGDPAHIPDLTHQDLLDFHRTYYHPSNAIVMSFGNLDPKEIQKELQDNALARFDDKERVAKGKRFFVEPEKRHTAPLHIHDTYMSDSAGEKMTHQVLAWLLPSITDPKMRLAFRLMEGVLIEHSGLPLRAYLEQSKLGQAPSPLLGLDDSHFEMVFYAGLRGSEIAHSEQVRDEILAVLSDVASRPIDGETIDTILHQMELDQRHIGGDSMPYGLTLMLEAFSTVIHGGDAISVWQVDESLAWLKEQLKDEMWLSNLIKTYLLDNPHRVHLTLSPDDKKSEKLNAQEVARLEKLNDELSDDDKANIRQKTADLLARQVMIDDVELLPKVTLDDIPSDIAFANANIESINIDGNVATLYQYDAGTNGLYYYQLACEIDDELLANPLMPLYLSLLSELGTDKYDARSFQARQASHSSGVTARISQKNDPSDKLTMKAFFVLATRSLASKLTAFDILKEVLTDTIFGETDRMREILTQKQMGWESRLSGSGHAYAMQTASRAMSVLGALEYQYSGLPALSALKAFLNQAGENEKGWETLANALLALHQKINALPKFAILVCEPVAKNDLVTALQNSLANLPAVKPTDFALPSVYDELKNEYQTLANLARQGVQGENLQNGDDCNDLAWLIATNVYHNASAYAVPNSNHSDTPALMVLAPFMRNGYLHGAIREKGGAYGGGASYDGNSGSLRFFSYRDPNCEATFVHFDKAIDWVIDNEHEPRLLEEAILGIMAGMDKPGSPAGDAVKACFATLHARDKAWQLSLRERILAVTIDDLKRVASTYLKDKPHSRATLAPADKSEVLEKLGFVVKKLN